MRYIEVDYEYSPLQPRNFNQPITHLHPNKGVERVVQYTT